MKSAVFKKEFFMTPILIFIFVILFVAFLFNSLAGRGITQVNAESAQGWLGDPGVAVIDVRTPQEFRSGHIRGAIPIPVSEIGGKIGSLDRFREKQILVCCLSGSRSMSAGRVLKKNGFTRIANLKGGLNSWIARGYSLEKGS